MNGDAIEFVRDQIRSAAVGKTIESVELVANPSSSPIVHSDEQLTLRFTDGSVLTLEIGSNANDFVQLFPGFTSPRLRLNFQPTPGRD
jgi:hypothetical protein